VLPNDNHNPSFAEALRKFRYDKAMEKRKLDKKML
jgi:hypothetical protein